MQTCMFTCDCASVPHIPILYAHDVSKQIPREKKISIGFKFYNTIGSYVCVRYASSNSSFLSALQTYQVPHISMNAR